MKYLVLILASMSSSAAMASATPLSGAALKDWSPQQMACLQDQIAVASRHSITGLEVLLSEIDTFAQAPSLADKTKADLVLYSDTGDVVKKYVLRLSSEEGYDWQYADLGDGKTFIYSRYASPIAEFFDNSLENGERLKKFLFTVDLEPCRSLIEIPN